MSNIMSTISENVLESGCTGLVGAAASKFILKRNGNVDLFGLIDLPEWQADGLLLVAESALADVAGEWIIPTVQEKLTGNESLSAAIQQAAPYAFTGGIHGGLKVYALDSYNAITTEILLGAGSKMAGNTIAAALF